MPFRYDIRSHSQMEEIRKMTGICPQHDVLFDELTAKEHLSFFARIRVRVSLPVNMKLEIRKLKFIFSGYGRGSSQKSCR